MNARFAGKFSLQPVQLQVNEHGLLRLNVRRRPLRLPVELPSGAALGARIKACLDRFLDHLFGV